MRGGALRVAPGKPATHRGLVTGRAPHHAGAPRSREPRPRYAGATPRPDREQRARGARMEPRRASAQGSQTAPSCHGRAATARRGRAKGAKRGRRSRRGRHAAAAQRARREPRLGGLRRELCRGEKRERATPRHGREQACRAARGLGEGRARGGGGPRHAGRRGRAEPAARQEEERGVGDEVEGASSPRGRR
jgi:hypothetical protein